MRNENLLHVYPLNDLRDHQTDRGADCWCHPTPDDESPDILVHHSMDGRESFERGERLPS